MDYRVTEEIGMTKDEANAKVDRLHQLPGLSARAVRILPAGQDPIRPGDNGWDVLVKVDESQQPSRSVARRLVAQLKS
jgi:hypothetical protein